MFLYQKLHLFDLHQSYSKQHLSYSNTLYSLGLMVMAIKNQVTLFPGDGV